MSVVPESVVIAAEVLARVEMVPEVEFSWVMLADPELRVVMPALVLVRVVIMAEVLARVVIVPLVAVMFPITAEPM